MLQRIKTIPQEQKVFSVISRQSVSLFTSLILLFNATSAFSQSDNAPVRMRTTSLGVGGIVLKDEYLSPLNYAGTVYAFNDERNSLITRDWVNQKVFSLSFGDTNNPAKNATIYALRARINQHFLRQIYHGAFGKLSVGPGYTIGVGGLYSTRNGNNPATLKLDGSLSLGISYSYRMPSNRLPILFRLSSRTNLIGTHWGQGYGESYYSMYYVSKDLGKRFVLTHLANAFSQELRLNIDIPIFKHLITSLSYQFSYHQWKINNLTNQQNSHAIMVGLTRYMQPLGGTKWLRENIQILPF